MAERQDEVLAECVMQPEGDLVVMVAPVDRIAGHVLQRVVHEAHVPFEPETERGARTLVECGCGHARPSGRFLGDRHNAVVLAVERTVGRAQELRGLPVLAPAFVIGNPFARFAAVVAVEHRGDGIDAQAVDMIFLGPEQRVVDEETLHLASSKVIDRSVPVGVEAQPRVLVLVKRGAVEPGETVLVDRKMRGHPVDQHAHPRPVRAVDEAGESLDVAEAGRRGIEAGRLVAPARVVRVLADRQELDMGEAHLDDIGDQPRGHLVPGQEPAVIVSLPRAGMNLVDRDRFPPRINGGPVGAVIGVAPLGLARLRDDRGRVGPQFRCERVRIGF